MPNNNKLAAIFNITVDNLIATGSWKMQTGIAWIASFLTVWHGLYWMDISFDQKALTVMSYLFVCAMAVFLSKTVRDGNSADKLDEYAKGTDLHIQTYVNTLRGTSLYHLFSWGVFGIALASMVYCLNNIDMNPERRGYLMISGFTLLMQTFTVVKTIRDSQEGENLRAQYAEELTK